MRRLHLILAILAALMILVISAAGYPPSKNEEKLRKTKSFSKGDDTVMYVWVFQKGETDNDTIFEKAIFYPKVDEYTSFTIPGSGKRFQKDKDLLVWIEFGGKTTSKKHYTNGKAWVPQWPVVITLNSGKVDKLDWDSGCDECRGDECIDDICGLSYDSYKCKDYDCNLSFLVGWVGQDENDEVLDSAGYLPSNFQFLAIYPAYKSAAGVTTDIVYNFGKA